MKISERTLQTLARVITGDIKKAPRRSGPQLVSFFNEFGFDDIYPKSGGFPSRWQFAEDKLRHLNGTPKLARAIEAALHATVFLETEFSSKTAAEHLNEFLKHDGFELRAQGTSWKVHSRGGGLVDVAASEEPDNPLTVDFIREAIAKTEQKIAADDFDGAITNARSLVEAVLRQIEIRRSDKPSDFKGDLPRQYSHVAKLLHLDPARTDLPQPLKQMLTGLVSVVHGIAAARNAMSDAHARTHRPERHHAVLVANAARTLADFLRASFSLQADRPSPKEQDVQGT